MDASWLSVFWASLIAFAILFYVILDGYDLGVGILSGTTRDAGFKDGMVDAITPFWDGNESWLILVGAGLFAAFPMVYSIFLSAFYLPITLMLIALIFRGVAFEFRYHAGACRWVWDRGFFLGSLLVAFVQGAAIGRMAQGLPVAAGQYAGGSFDWLTPFSVFCGVGLVIGYALLGAAWIVIKTEGPLQDWAYMRLRWLLVGALAVLVTVWLHVLGSQVRVRDRWLTDVWIFPIPADHRHGRVRVVDRREEAPGLGPLRHGGHHLLCGLGGPRGVVLGLHDTVLRFHCRGGGPGRVAQVPLLWCRGGALPPHPLLYRHGLLDPAGKGLM